MLLFCLPLASKVVKIQFFTVLLQIYFFVGFTKVPPGPPPFRREIWDPHPLSDVVSSPYNQPPCFDLWIILAKILLAACQFYILKKKLIFSRIPTSASFPSSFPSTLPSPLLLLKRTMLTSEKTSRIKLIWKSRRPRPSHQLKTFFTAHSKHVI
jgi:hypothetical protein